MKLFDRFFWAVMSTLVVLAGCFIIAAVFFSIKEKNPKSHSNDPIMQFEATHQTNEWHDPATNAEFHISMIGDSGDITNFLTISNRPQIHFQSQWCDTILYHFTDAEWSLLTNYYLDHYETNPLPTMFEGRIKP